jgi:hypothetical protein
LSGPDEPLALSAPLARTLAATLCRNSAHEDCAWSHGLWQYLRIMGLATGPGHHAAFYRAAFASVRAPARAAPRLLIAGTADYAMLAHALAAFRSQQTEPRITVIDLCETPLALNRWYAERTGCAIETQRCDVLEYTAREPFDAVCSDSFLGRFPASRRPALASVWHRLLRPGGAAITVKRLRADSTGAETGFTGEQARAFVDAVRRAAESLREQLQLDPEVLVADARVYAARQRTWPVRTQEEITALFEHAGFRVECTLAPDRPTGSAPTGPTTPGNAPYAQVIATRV